MNNFFKEFLQYMIGPASAPQFLATMVFAYLVAFAMMLYRTGKVVSNLEAAPLKERSIWAGNSKKRNIANAIFIYIVVVFAAIWIPAQYVVYTGPVVGLISDYLGYLFEKIADAAKINAENKINSINKPNSGTQP